MRVTVYRGAYQPATARAVRALFAHLSAEDVQLGRPEYDLAIEKAAAVLNFDGYGVEHLTDGRMRPEVAVSYANTGEPFSPTVLCVWRDWPARLAVYLGRSWGDLAERPPRDLRPCFD